MDSQANTRCTAEALWRFSLALYARPHVAAALLSLQDRANVNLMMFALWLGAVQHRRFDAEALTTAAAIIAPVDEPIVRPLRALRRRLKASGDSDIQSLRRRAGALELAAERAVLARLAAEIADRVGAMAADNDDGLTLAIGNLALMLGSAAGSPEALALSQALADLVRGRSSSSRN